MQTTQNKTLTFAAALQTALQTALQQNNIVNNFVCTVNKTQTAVHVKFSKQKFFAHAITMQTLFLQAVNNVAQQLNMQNFSVLNKCVTKRFMLNFAIVFSNVQQQCATVVQNKNNAVNMCFVTQQQQKQQFLQVLRATLLQNNVAVHKTNAVVYKQAVTLVLRKKQHMQTALLNVYAIAKQLQLNVHKVIAKNKKLRIYLHNNALYNKTLFTTINTAKHYALTHAQIMQILQQFANSVNTLQKNCVNTISSNYFSFVVKSNMQQQTAAALQNVLIANNISATVMQQTQTIVVLAKHVLIA